MKHDIIKTDNYLLIVDDSEIKAGNFIYEADIDTINTAGKDYRNFKKSDAKITAHLPLDGAPVLEGVDLLPPIEDDGCKDLFYSKQVMNPYSKESQSYTAYEKGFIDGYNKAKEKYKYTEEDLRKAIDMAREQYKVKYTDNEYEFKYPEDEVIQSIQQPKMPVGFECDMEMCENNDVVFEDGSFNKSPYRLEKKKIKNSQGQTVWIGKYLFND